MKTIISIPFVGDVLENANGDMVKVTSVENFITDEENKRHQLSDFVYIRKPTVILDDERKAQRDLFMNWFLDMLRKTESCLERDILRDNKENLFNAWMVRKPYG